MVTVHELFAQAGSRCVALCAREVRRQGQATPTQMKTAQRDGFTEKFSFRE